MSVDPLRQAFLEEAAELLADFESGLLTLEGAPDDAGLLNRIFRSAHTLTMISGHAGILPGQPPEGVGGSYEDATREERALQKAAEEFRATLDQLGMPDSLRKQIRIEVTREGLRIELIERDNAPFFSVGSAVVLPTLRPVLEQLSHVVAKLPNNITIEGHTDSRRYTNEESYSNWELSSDRTNSARRVME